MRAFGGPQGASGHHSYTARATMSTASPCQRCAAYLLRMSASVTSNHKRGGATEPTYPEPGYIQSGYMGRIRIYGPAPPNACEAVDLSGTGVERQPDAEGLLARCAFGSLQFLGNLRRRRFLSCHRLQLTNFSCSPGTPLLFPLRHNTSLSRKAACIPYGGERKATR